MQKKDKINVDNAEYDSCGVRIIAASDMPVSLWSGGRTTEIYIAPEGALYAERNFLFRISTAEVELEESDFTSLPDYNRLIASVSGTMRLSHGANGSEKLVLPRSTVYAFDGGIQTHCVGKARDLNLMLRKGAAEGELVFVDSGTELDLEPAANETMLLLSWKAEMPHFAQAGMQGCAARQTDSVRFSPFGLSERRFLIPIIGTADFQNGYY